MNCYFCQKKCYLSTVSDYGEHWICNKHVHKVIHQINYTYHKSDDCEGPDCCPKKELSSISAPWVHHNKYYIVNFNYKEKSFIVRNRIESPYSKINYLIWLNFLPNLTPEEFDAKLPTWITFS